MKMAELIDKKHDEKLEEVLTKYQKMKEILKQSRLLIPISNNPPITHVLISPTALSMLQFIHNDKRENTHGRRL
jgi:hypothetical protein